MARLPNRLLASVALACFAAAAHAEDDYDRAGCYVGAAPSYAMPRDDDLADESLGLHARVGCREGVLGGELHFEWLEGFEVDDATGTGTSLVPGDDYDGWALSLDGKVYPLSLLGERLPPLARRFQPFATLGFGGLTLEGSSGFDEWDFLGRLGGGLDVYLTRHLAISADVTWVVPVADELEDFDYLSLGAGLLYRF